MPAPAAPPAPASDARRAEEVGAASAFAAKARDLDALRAAVVDAAGVGTGLWLSYLFVLFYLAVAAASVTHRDLLLENPVKLPFLSVELPLSGFFVLGPAIFLVAHAYVLLHFLLLAGKVGAFHAELQAQVADEDTRTRLRRQLPSNIFVQILAGPQEVRTGFTGLLLRLVAHISLAAAPIALLVLFLLQFLPYHDEWISWWHRIAVAVDLALLWALWPSVARGERASMRLRDLRRAPVAASGFATACVLLLVFTVATFPGEWLDRNPVSARTIPTWGDDGSVAWTTPHRLLVAGDVDFVARKPTSLWSNRLVLPGIDVVDRAKLNSDPRVDADPATLSLRARRLEGAVLIGARMRKVDFTGARLDGAALTGADLREATFLCENRRARLEDARKAPHMTPRTHCAQLQGAVMNLARLQGAHLDGAHLDRASLVWADLQGASLHGARLEGADLFGARLDGALLDRAQLRRASLVLARLHGTRLFETQLEGADLNTAFVSGAVREAAPLPEIAPLRHAGCNVAGAPYVIPAILRNFRYTRVLSDEHRVALATAFLDEAHCPAARRLSPNDRAALEEMRNDAAQRLPAPR